MYSTRRGRLERKIKAWSKKNGASQGAYHNRKKLRISQSGSILCTEIGTPRFSGRSAAFGHDVSVCDYVVDLELLLERMLGKSKHNMDRLSELRMSIQQKKEALLRCEGSNAVIKQIKTHIEVCTWRLQELQSQILVAHEELKEVQHEFLEASSREGQVHFQFVDGIVKEVKKEKRTTSSAASSRSTRSKKSSSDDERTDTDKEQDSQESAWEDVPKRVEAAGPSEYKRSDEEDTSTPLEKKSQKPRSREQVLMDEAMARVEARRKELADARAAKAAKTARSTTMEETRKLRIEKAKALQKERKRLEAEEKAQEEAEVAQATQTQEKEVIDLSGTVECLKKIEKEKYTAEQRAAQLAREKIKEALSRKTEEPVLEPNQRSPKRPRQEEEEEIEHIQADPIPSSPMNIPPAPPSSPITPFPPTSIPRTPPSPSPLDLPRSPPAPTSPQQQQFSVEPTEIPTSLQEETEQPMDRTEEEEKQTDSEQQKPAEIDLSIPIMQLEELTNEEAFQEERDTNAKENENLLRDLIDLQSQLTRKEAQNHELIKNEKKMKEQLNYTSTSDSATANTLAALQEELQTEKLQRQLLVSGFMSQTAQHEAKVKQLELELAQAKADLEAVGSLVSTSQIHQAETHLHIQQPLMPEMPEFQSPQEEEQPRPVPGALDIREQMEQEVEDMLEEPAKEYLLYEKKVMESAALAFLQPDEQITDFGHDFLPLPLMRHEVILWKEKKRSAVPRNEEGGYEGIPLTSEEAQTLIEDHPKWRKKWLSERPRDLTNFHNTPQYLQIDPTYSQCQGEDHGPNFKNGRAKIKHYSTTRYYQHKNHPQLPMW
ncbi:hypothetical protein L7F22_034804 [Adiantum nelumboides]|nr:hypothetical protein [Adiantum nelumboides]